MLRKIKENVGFAVTALTLTGIIFGFIIEKAVWASEIENRVDRIEQQQLENSKVRNEILQFTMDLWRIDPDVQKKWKKFPKFPTQTTDSTIEGYKIVGMKYFLFYHGSITKNDTTLMVDTLYIYKKE